MATLERIRKKGKLLAIVIGLALAAFILGDVFTSGKALFNSQESDVVIVNGDGVNVQEYEEQIRQTETYYQLLRGASGSLDEQVSQQIRSSVWEMIIREALLSETYNELGLTISKDEMKDLFIGNNVHPMIKQTFLDPQTGQYDKTYVQELYQNFDQVNAENPQQAEQLRLILKYTEDYIRKDRAYNKYLSLVSKGLYVTSLEAEEVNAEKNYIVNLDVVGKTISDLGQDSSITVSKSDMQKYYDKHKAMFKVNVASRDISYITFDVLPSPADTNYAVARADDLKLELISSDDEQRLVSMKSSNPQIVKYYTEKELNDSVLFNNEIGSVYGPYLKSGKLNVAKVIAKGERPDTVTARHILISPQDPSIGSIARANVVADSLIEVLNNGGDFVALVAEFSADQGSIQKGGTYEDITEGTMTPKFNDFCFETELNRIGKVETEYGVHIVEVTKQSPNVAKTKVAFIQVDIVPSQATYDSIYSYAMKVKGVALEKSGYEKVIQDSGYVKREAPNLVQGTYTIPGIGNAKDIISWSFKSEKEAEVSTVFQVGDKYIIAMVERRNELGYQPLNKVKEKVENSVKQEKQVESIYNAEFANQTVSNLNDFATKIGVKEVSVPSVSFSAFQLANIGYEPAILGVITKLTSDKIYGPIKGINGVYFVKATSINKNNQLTAEELTEQKNILTSTSQQRVSYQAYNALKTSSEIVDRRYVFY